MEQIFMIKENYIYVGIDLHKETHTAVMIDCYNQKLGEITFPNRPADFPKLVAKVKKCNTDGKTIVFGLENAYGYGRALAVWLIDKGYLVKDVTPPYPIDRQSTEVPCTVKATVMTRKPLLWQR